MKTIRWMLVAFLTLFGSISVSNAQSSLVKVRFADLGLSNSNLYQYLGVEKGIYKKYGIDLELVSFLKGGPEVIAAAASQQIDLGGIGTPTLTGISRGIPIKIVGSPPIKGQEFILVSRKDITSVADLKGKTVGVSSVGGGQSQALRFILIAKKIPVDDVPSIAFGSSTNGYLALKSGQLAAAVLSEPWVTKIELEGSGKVLEEAADYYGQYQHSYIFATNRFIKENPQVLRHFFIANREALNYAKTHQDELIDFGSERLKLEKAILERLFKKQIPKWDDTFSLDQEGVLNAFKIIQDLGDISKSYQPDLKVIADLRFIP